MAYIGAVAPGYDPTRASVPQLDAERFSGNASTTAFTLARQVVSPTDIDVVVENVTQEPTVAYSVNGNTLTFTEAPGTGTNNIYVVYRGSGISNYAFVPDGSITYAKLANNIKQFTVDAVTANGTGTTVELTEAPASANSIIVSVDGVIQTAPTNYTLSGSTITFTGTPDNGANVVVRHIGFRTTSTVTALQASSVTATELADSSVTNAKIVSVANTKISGNIVSSQIEPSVTLTTPLISGNLNLDSAGTTGIRVPSANTITFHTAGTEDMRIDATGNVGIGTASPAQRLDVVSSSGFTPFKFKSSYSQAGLLGTDNSAIWMGVGSDGLVTRYRVDATNDVLTMHTGSTERMRIASDGKVGIGTSSPNANFQVNGGIQVTGTPTIGSTGVGVEIGYGLVNASEGAIQAYNRSGSAWINMAYSALAHKFLANNSEAMRIDSSGNVMIGKTTFGSANVGTQIEAGGVVVATRNSNVPFISNRTTNDGSLFSFRQDDTEEGTISVSGTTVSYNGGHLSRWAQTTTAKDESLVKGTVLSNLDAMNVYTDADGFPVANEQLNKVKVSDVEGDANVAGVFVNWSYDEAHQVDEINMAMTGDMIIRIAQGVTVQRGDLLMSAGDGTAKPQSDDIVRSKTIAKVTSNHVTCTYADGSYCVPCVLMAC